MKKLFTFVFAAFAALSMNAATLELPLATFGDTGWGGCTYDAATSTVTFPVAWEGGIGWWIAADYSQYDRVVVEFASALPMQVAINIEYYKDGDSETSNGYEQFFAGAGSKSIEAKLDAAKKSAVQKIYLQAAAAGAITLKKAYATSDAAVDPLEGLTGEAIEIEGTDAGNYCYVPLALIKQYDYIEVLIENMTGTKENGWGIGKIVPVSDWSNPTYEFGCNNPGLGKVNRYVIAQADMLEYAKKNGVYHTDEYQQQGVHIGSYNPDSKLTSVKGYAGGSGSGSSTTTKTDLGTPDEYGTVYLDLATLNKYDEFEIVINITNAEVGANWGIGKIVPVGLWTGPYFEYKTIKAGAGEQTIVIEQADMLEYAKVDGAYYKDEYERQGVMVQAYDDKAKLVKVVGVSKNGSAALQNTNAEQKVRKVLENGRLYILRGNQRIDMTGRIAY